MQKKALERYSILLLMVSLCLSSFVSPKPVYPQQEIKRKLSPDLRPFLESYFASWSKHDIEGYRAHFQEQAVILFIERGQVRQLQSLEAFIKEQANYLSTVTESVVEKMTSFTADEDNKSAMVSAQWVLIKGQQRKKGVDRFTLIRDLQGHWKIVCLVWYLKE